MIESSHTHCHIHTLFFTLSLMFIWAFSRLQVISTRVGGVPEVLPPDLIRLADPSVTGMDVCSMYCDFQYGLWRLPIHKRCLHVHKM